MKISVNILCWNTLPTLRASLDVLNNELRNVDHEIIIIDNGSNDHTDQYVVQSKIPNIKYQKNTRNLGISRGKNQGIRCSSGEYIFLLDGDIVPVPNSVLSLAHYLDSQADCQAIGFSTNHYTKDKDKAEKRCNELVCIREHNFHCIYYGMYKRSVFYDHDVWMDTAGVLGEEGYGYEDLDFFQQMKQAGIKQWVAEINHPTGKYYHEINSSIRNMGRQKYVETSKKRHAYFKRKWAHVGA